MQVEPLEKRCMLTSVLNVEVPTGAHYAIGAYNTHDVTGDGRPDIEIHFDTEDGQLVGLLPSESFVDAYAAEDPQRWHVNNEPNFEAEQFFLPIDRFVPFPDPSDGAFPLTDVQSSDQGFLQLTYGEDDRYVVSFDGDAFTVLAPNELEATELGEFERNPESFDFNGDGTLDQVSVKDLAPAAYVILPEPVVEIENSDWRFVPKNPLSEIGEAFSIGDYDGDGADDLLIVEHYIGIDFSTRPLRRFVLQGANGEISHEIPPPEFDSAGYFSGASPVEGGFIINYETDAACCIPSVLVRGDSDFESFTSPIEVETTAAEPNLSLDFNGDGILDEVIINTRQVDVIYGQAEVDLVDPKIDLGLSARVDEDGQIVLNGEGAIHGVEFESPNGLLEFVGTTQGFFDFTLANTATEVSLRNLDADRLLHIDGELTLPIRFLGNELAELQARSWQNDQLVSLPLSGGEPGPETMGPPVPSQTPTVIGDAEICFDETFTAGDDLYFIGGRAGCFESRAFASSGFHGGILRKTDGTIEGTNFIGPNREYRSDEPGTFDGFSTWYFDKLAPKELQFAEFQGLMYFAFDDGMHGSELWRTNGTPEGTSLVKDINPTIKTEMRFADEADYNQSSTIQLLQVQNDQLVFSAFDGVETANWVSNGTANGTRKASDLTISPVEETTPRYAVEYRDGAFVRTDSETGEEVIIAEHGREAINVHAWGDKVIFNETEVTADLSSPIYALDLFPEESIGQTVDELVGDLDRDGMVAFTDFLAFSANFGKQDADATDGDFDGDGKVDFPDFLVLSANYGKTLAG